ncbi:MAG: hypothetical protein M0019_09565 [Actinomycetota bacterium]|nr:hypothetical protein [Actinomycetota bacterium]
MHSSINRGETALTIFTADEITFNQGEGAPKPVSLIVYGAPVAPRPATVTVDFVNENFAKRLSSATNSMVVVANLSGTADSGGYYTPLTWKKDIETLISYVSNEFSGALVHLIAFELAGTAALAAAVQNPLVQSLVSVGITTSPTPFSLSTYELADQLEARGVRISSSIEQIKAWSLEFEAIDPFLSVPLLKSVPWLIITQQTDEEEFSRLKRLASELDGHSEVHTIIGTGETLRADPRTFALIVGWLARADED